MLKIPTVGRYIYIDHNALHLAKPRKHLLFFYEMTHMETLYNCILTFSFCIKLLILAKFPNDYLRYQLRRRRLFRFRTVSFVLAGRQNGTKLLLF